MKILWFKVKLPLRGRRFESTEDLKNGGAEGAGIVALLTRTGSLGVSKL